MTEKEIKELHRQLLDLQKELQGQEAEFNKDSAPVELDQTKVGRLSRMDAMQIQQMALETSRRRQQQLVKINTALQRMEQGEYGYCLRCEDQIDIRRLRIDPAVTLCIKCADNR